MEGKGKKEEKGENRIGRSDRGGRVNETVCVKMLTVCGRSKVKV